MSSKVIPRGGTMLGHNTTNKNGTSLSLHERANMRDEIDKSEVDLCKNLSSPLKRQYGSNGIPPEWSDFNSFDLSITSTLSSVNSSEETVGAISVPTFNLKVALTSATGLVLCMTCLIPNECIYAQSKSNSDTSVDNLIPSAAKLLLQQNPKTRSDLLSQDRSDSGTETATFDFEDQDFPPENDYDYTPEDFRDSSYNDYGLEVIQEETESQMSSDSEQDFENPLEEYYTNPRSQSKMSSSTQPQTLGIHEFTDSHDNIMNIQSNAGNGANESHSQQQANLSDEIIMKHIRIPPNWDPAPILLRLCAMIEPKQVSQNNAPKEATTGYLSILSGNRKKGTFWNAWKRKFYVVASGRLSGYEKEDCQELFQSISLVGGKVDFLDPSEFVGSDQNKTMTNRIVGVDDGKGHYFVLQCPTAKEAGQWVAALQHEVSSTLMFAVPILTRAPSLFRDIILVDFGSTNIRAGVLTHQPTLPALFFAAVMSENTETGKTLFGNDVYITANRKNAKIKFPIESSSKMCQNTLNMAAIKGFLEKIFKDLAVRPENYRIIINLPRRVDSSCRKNLLQLLFHTFQVRSTLLCHQSVVSFWAYSADNGIICDIGERCDIVPVSQGFVLSHAWGRAPFGGQPLKHALRQGLGPQENGLYLSTPAENLVLRFISENFIYISGNGVRRTSQEAQEIVVEMDLRDVLSFSNLIGVNQNILRGVAEGFFDPGLYGLDCDSLQKILFKSLQDCGMDIRKEMSQNIFLTGGCTLIPGFAERLELELTKLCPPHLKPKIQVSPYRYHASFIGASVLASTEAFEKSILHKSKYDDGPGPSHWLI